MLATAAPAVKLPTYSTPEQAGCAQAIDRSLTIFWTLVERLRSAADQRQPIHQVEEAIFRDLLAMGLDLLRAFLALSGDGDAGPNLTVPGDGPDDPPRVLPRLDQPRRRPYLSIFGEVEIERIGYGHDRLDAAPLDARLHLPRRQYSYLFQQWLGVFVVDDAHAEAIKKLQTILGLEVSVKASEDLNREQGSDVEPFQNHLPTPEAAQEGPILVVTADCKGVPLVRKALPPEEATDTPLPASANPRRGKGEKANKKKMAAVGAVYTIEPFVRTADEVIDEVMREKAAQRRPKPAHKRVRRRVAGGQGGVVPLAGRRGRAPQPDGDQAVDLPLGRGTRACTIARVSTCLRTRSVSWTCSTSWSGCGRRRGASSTRRPRSGRPTSGWRRSCGCSWKGR